MMVGDFTRAKQMRALMIVLPYSASIKDDVSSMQDLYTKAPVTRVIQSEVKPPIAAVTQKPPARPTLGLTTTTRRSTTMQYEIPEDLMVTSFKPMPSFDLNSFTTTTERQTITIPNELETILKQMKIDTNHIQATTQKSEQVHVAPDVRDVLESLGLWEENEQPAVFSKQTVSENFAPIDLDFETGTVRTVRPEISQEVVPKKLPSPEVVPTDFVSFKPIPKLDKSEIPIENYNYFKSVGLLDSPKESRAYSASHPVAPKQIISSKAQGFSRRKSDVSYETDILKNISKQDREQLLDVLKKLEKQVVAGKIGPNPIDHTEINVPKKDYKRQEAVSADSTSPTKFSFNFDTSEKDDGVKDAKDTTTPAVTTIFAETLSDDLPLPTSEDDGQGRIVNKGNITADTTPDAVLSTTTQSTKESNAESFTLPAFNMDEIKLDNLEDSSDTGGLDPVADAEAPPEKKNGFYFLADWNSFLEVGEGKDRVEVRFTPRVGDSRLFIPVHVP